MPRVALDLNDGEDRAKVSAGWRVADGLVPGEPNEGLVSQMLASPALDADFDDSGWEECNNVRASRAVGFTFGWWRCTVQLPENIDGVSIAGSRVFFETNADNYGEVWVDGEIDRATGVVVGINAQHRVEVSNSAVPGTKHVIACLVANGPLAKPRGGIFLRYATLAFESAG